MPNRATQNVNFDFSDGSSALMDFAKNWGRNDPRRSFLLAPNAYKKYREINRLQQLLPEQERVIILKVYFEGKGFRFIKIKTNSRGAVQVKRDIGFLKKGDWIPILALNPIILKRLSNAVVAEQNINMPNYDFGWLVLFMGASTSSEVKGREDFKSIIDYYSNRKRKKKKQTDFESLLEKEASDSISSSDADVVDALDRALDQLEPGQEQVEKQEKVTKELVEEEQEAIPYVDDSLPDALESIEERVIDTSTGTGFGRGNPGVNSASIRKKFLERRKQEQAKKETLAILKGETKESNKEEEEQELVD